MGPEEFNAMELEHAARGAKAQATAAQALGRLLTLAEQGHSGQPRRVARLIASLYAGDTFPFSPTDLRPLDIAISDDVLACLDAVRWGRCPIEELVPEGRTRVLRVLETWGIDWPAE